MILLIVLGIRVARRFYKYYFQYTSYSNNNQQQCYRIEFLVRGGLRGRKYYVSIE